jgi:DNA-binding NarL/FixJ family response regulator
MANILIIDDHPLILSSIKQLVELQFPTADITTAPTASVAERELANIDRNWQLVLADLSIPTESGDTARSETGLALLRTIMKLYPDLNLMVYSSNLKVLVQLKHMIDNHRGGFTIADKTLEPTEVRRRMQYAIEGITLTKEIRKGLELKPEWLSTLQLADRGLPDRAISERLNVTERAVRHYWSKVQDVLEIDRDNLNLRILTLNRARAEGLID